MKNKNRKGLLMQAAFFVGGVFPPPSAGANVFAETDGTGARLATNAGKTGIVQFVVRHCMAADIIPDLCFRPVNERIQFQQTIFRKRLGRTHL